MNLTHCLVCGSELPEPDGSGRPRKYCGDACRRTREFEVRGVVRQINAAEDKAQKARYAAEFPSSIYANERRKAQKEAQARVRWWEAEAERLRDRLRVLLAGEDTSARA